MRIRRTAVCLLCAVAFTWHPRALTGSGRNSFAFAVGAEGSIRVAPHVFISPWGRVYILDRASSISGASGLSSSRVAAGVSVRLGG